LIFLQNKLECLYQATAIAYPSEAPFRLRLLALQADIRQGWKGLPRTKPSFIGIFVINRNFFKFNK